MDQFCVIHHSELDVVKFVQETATYCTWLNPYYLMANMANMSLKCSCWPEQRFVLKFTDAFKVL